MSLSGRGMRTFFAALICIGAAVADAQAQSYPSRPITLVAPTSPGGPPDTIGRILGERMKVTLGQPVIVENVTGAGGSLGVQRVARAAPVTFSTMTGWPNVHLFMRSPRSARSCPGRARRDSFAPAAGDRGSDCR